MSIFDEPKIDCHNHLFEPLHFPYRADTLYRPAGQEIGTLAQFNRVLDAYGVQHALLVGPTSGYRTDNGLLLHALAQGQGRFKGIAVVEHDASLEQLAVLQAAGVVGVAFNPAGEGTAVMRGAEGLFSRLAELGMFAQVQVKQDELLQLLPLLTRSAPQLLIDHCGRPQQELGVSQAGFAALLRLAEGGRTCVKISGMQKFAHIDALVEQAGAYVQALLEAFGPQACVWGSDWPFLREQSRIDYGPLLKYAEVFMPDAQVRRQVMWDTPRRLFGFV